MAKIYQLYYTRLGKQGSGAGWQVAAVSEGTPQLVQNAFAKLASNLVTAGSAGHVPGMALDLRILENYAFFSHVNYHSVNEGSQTDHRGVSFVHGFAVRLEEYRELIRRPESIIGLDLDQAVTNYSGEKELPVLESLPFAERPQEELLAAWHMNQDRFDCLMGCVYGALGSVGGSLTICSSRFQGEECRGVFQDVLCMVLRSLPYLLRLKVSAFSGQRSGTLLCFSDKAPDQGNWFSLDTGRYSGQPLPEYEFIRQLNYLELTEENRTRLYDALEQFTDITYGGNYEAVKLNHMELAYRAVTCRTTEEELDEHMKEAAGLRAARYDRLDEYYAHLTEMYVRNGREFPGPEVFRKLQKRYVETACAALKTAFADYYAEKVCLPGDRAAYDMLYRLEEVRPEDYRYLMEKLETVRPQFLDAYYVEYYLEQKITGPEQLKAMVQGDPAGLTPEVARKLMELLVKFFRAEFAAAGSNQQRHTVCRSYRELCGSFPGSPAGQTAACLAMLRREYWEAFDEREFTYHSQKEYADMGAGEDRTPGEARKPGEMRMPGEARKPGEIRMTGEARIPGRSEASAVPEKIRMLLEARTRFIQGPDIENFRNVFLSDAVISDQALRRRLLGELREEADAMGGMPLDAYLLLDGAGAAGFHQKQLVRAVELCAGKGPDLYQLGQVIGTSRILTPGSRAEEELKAQLREWIRGRDVPYVISQLYDYYFPRPEGESEDVCLMDLLQKCLMFCAVTLTCLVAARYLSGIKPAYGIAALIAGLTVALGGLVVQLFFGRTNSIELLQEMPVMIVVPVVSVLICVCAGVALMLVPEVWILYVLAAAAVILVAGSWMIQLKFL